MEKDAQLQFEVETIECIETISGIALKIPGFDDVGLLVGLFEGQNLQTT